MAPFRDSPGRCVHLAWCRGNVGALLGRHWSCSCFSEIASQPIFLPSSCRRQGCWRTRLSPACNREDVGRSTYINLNCLLVNVDVTCVQDGFVLEVCLRSFIRLGCAPRALQQRIDHLSTTTAQRLALSAACSRLCRAPEVETSPPAARNSIDSEKTLAGSEQSTCLFCLRCFSTCVEEWRCHAFPHSAYQWLGDFAGGYLLRDGRFTSRSCTTTRRPDARKFCADFFAGLSKPPCSYTLC